MAKFYVGTYKKYNEGSLFGAWMDTDDYADAEEFFNACAELHKDESDPEYMFQDYEDCPSKYYSESMNEGDLQELFDYLNEYDDDQRQIIEEYWDEVSESAEPSAIMRKYCGEMSGKEYAEQLCEECGGLESVPVWLRNNIDWEGVWWDMHYDYSETTNYIFADR